MQCKTQFGCTQPRRLHREQYRIEPFSDCRQTPLCHYGCVVLQCAWAFGGELLVPVRGTTLVIGQSRESSLYHENAQHDSGICFRVYPCILSSAIMAEWCGLIHCTKIKFKERLTEYGIQSCVVIFLHWIAVSGPSKPSYFNVMFYILHGNAQFDFNFHSAFTKMPC